MLNNLSFSGEGPVMSGTWYNPQTGDSFTVEDSYFQDNQYLVKTTDGRMLDYNFIQNYVKSDAPMPKQSPQSSTPTKSQTYPQDVLDMIQPESDILPEDQYLISGNPFVGPTNSYINNSLQTTTYKEDPIISRALSRKPLPKIDFKIDDKSFPKKAIDMLIEIMGITEEEIVEWYINKIDINVIKEGIKESLKKIFEAQDKEEEHIEPFYIPEPKKEVIKEIPKKTIKKSKK